MTGNGTAPGVTFRVAVDELDVRAARELIFRSFGPSYFDFRAIKELQALAEPEEHRPENYMLALSDDRIAGVMHYYPQEVRIGGVSSRMATLAEFCVDPDAAPRFLGLSLLRQSLEVIAARGFPICWGAARRLMDNYYCRVGFSGIGAYCRVTLEKPAVHGRDRVVLRAFDPEHIGRYDAAHRRTYGQTWASLSRSHGRWRLIGELDRRRMGPRFAEFQALDGTGYVIWNDDALLETSFEAQTVDPRRLLASINEETGGRLSALLLPFDHPAMLRLGNAHLTLSYRRVPDAGLIGKVLVRDAVVRMLSEILQSRLNAAGLAPLRLEHAGVVVDWTPQSGVQVSALANGAADTWLLTLLFQGLDPIDGASVADPRWHSLFPKRYFTLSPVDGV